MEKVTSYKNPIVQQRADPWVYRHKDGYYYFTGSVPEYDRIEIRRSKTIQGLATASATVVWRQKDHGPMSANIWAPEIHYINNKWYIYYAAASKEEIFRHRMYVLENNQDNPLTGHWEEKGQVKTDWDSFSLDATTFEHKEARFYVWAQNDSKIGDGTNLYIAKLLNPWTIEGPQIMISKPEYDWEKIGFWVNEGPAVLKKNGKIFISYSASATDHNYCMGLLMADDNSDLLKPTSWTKLKTPVFQSNERAKQYGPGHNSFTVSEDGCQDILIYHARNYQDIIGNPLWDPNRHTRAQVVNWHENGVSNFGSPVPDSIN